MTRTTKMNRGIPVTGETDAELWARLDRERDALEAWLGATYPPCDAGPSAPAGIPVTEETDVEFSQRRSDRCGIRPRSGPVGERHGVDHDLIPRCLASSRTPRATRSRAKDAMLRLSSAATSLRSRCSSGVRPSRTGTSLGPAVEGITFFSDFLRAIVWASDVA